MDGVLGRRSTGITECPLPGGGVGRREVLELNTQRCATGGCIGRKACAGRRDDHYRLRVHRCAADVGRRKRYRVGAVLGIGVRRIGLRAGLVVAKIPEIGSCVARRIGKSSRQAIYTARKARSGSGAYSDVVGLRSRIRTRRVARRQGHGIGARCAVNYCRVLRR